MSIDDLTTSGELHTTLTTEQAERILGTGYLATITLEIPPGINDQASPFGTLTVEYPSEPAYTLHIDTDDFYDNVTDEATFRAWAISRIEPLRSVHPGSYPANTSTEGAQPRS